MKSSVQSIPLVGFLLLGGSCGGKVGETLRPEEHSAQEALKGGKAVACTGDAAYARPLIVDLDPDARVDLEASMKSGVVVVSYDCTSLRVLTNCRVPDSGYEYAGVSRKEQVVQINSEDDLHANLPLSQVKLSGELKSGRSIDLGLVLVGRNSTTVGKLSHEELTGSCEGATHFLQNATLGAFSMVTGSVGKVAVVAEVFKYGVGAKSESERKAMNSDGLLEACRSSDPNAATPPSECQAPLRIELLPIVGEASAVAAAPKAEKGEKTEKLAVAQENPCPAGYKYVDDLCTKSEAKAYLCDPGDESDCKAQCDKGSPESCFNYGVLLHKSRRAEQALDLYKKACDAEFADACGAYGQLAYSIEEGAAGLKINREVLKVVNRGCVLGGARACTVAGNLLSEKDFKMVDKVLAASAYDRGCKLGDSESCFNGSYLALKGDGVAKDPSKGVEMLQRACLGGDGGVCFELSLVLGSGKYGVAKNPDAAYSALVTACKGDTDYCVDTVKAAEKLGKHDDAFKFAKRGCDNNDDLSCVRLGDFYRAGTGTSKDEAKAKQTWEKSCKNGSEDGSEDACKRLGIKMKG